MHTGLQRCAKVATGSGEPGHSFCTFTGRKGTVGKKRRREGKVGRKEGGRRVGGRREEEREDGEKEEEGKRENGRTGKREVKKNEGREISGSLCAGQALALDYQVGQQAGGRRLGLGGKLPEEGPAP